MKLLKDILYGVRLDQVSGSTNIAIDAVHFDTRQITGYSLFVAIRGAQVDGHRFVENAIQKGAVAIIVEEWPDEVHSGVTYIKVDSSSKALGIIASNFFENPSEKLKLIGITGTNGKTTCATLLYELLKLLGHKVGLLSTVVNKINKKEVASTHTTPNPIALNSLLNDMVEEGCQYCFMEVSSHAIVQDRIAGLDFDGGVFTNISHEHLDYHGSFNEYIKAKKQFFDELSSHGFALVNKDDRHGEIMLQNCNAKHRYFALKTVADYKAKIVENQFSGLQLNIDNKELWSKLVGSFNAMNLLTVYGVAMELGLNQMDVLTGISQLSSVEGRFQYLSSQDGVIGIVDYAHTPDALKNVLATINKIRTGNEKVITIVGCGGDRDREKRPVMASIACELSDKIIFTSDNPRSEDPATIISEMEKGVEPQHYKKTLSVSDRKEAIKTACSLAEKQDIILIAGKGHEKYQETNGVKAPFDDLQVLTDFFKLLRD